MKVHLDQVLLGFAFFLVFQFVFLNIDVISKFLLGLIVFGYYLLDVLWIWLQEREEKRVGKETV